MRTSTLLRLGTVVPIVMLVFAGSAFAQRTVTLRLNTATAPDTLKTSDVIQVRGCTAGCMDNIAELPDGNMIAWDDRTTLLPANVGGDYWETSFQLEDTSALAFKFYAQLLEDDGVGGWEDGDDHSLAAGTGDTTLSLHYYRKGSTADYDWRPWEMKEDTIAVYFRVYMRTEEALAGGVGYDRTNPALEVAVRGDDFTQVGPLDWGTNKLILAPESDSESAPGYDLFSAVAFYPDSLAGRDQAYKFIVGSTGWEESLGSEEDYPGGNRHFTIPSTDTTLHYVYFGNSAVTDPTTEPVESELIFTVDLDPFEEIGIFRKARGDTIEVRGTFNGWDCPAPGDDCLLVEVPATNQFERAIPVTQFPESDIAYKYFLNFNDAEFEAEFGAPPPSGWEEGINTGNDRGAVFEGLPSQDLGVQYFNNIQPENVIPSGVSVDVLFSVNMDSTDAAQPFNPSAGDSVFIEINDPIWGFIGGYDTFLNGAGDERPDIVGLLSDDDADGVYTGTLTVEGPTYSLLTLKFMYGQRDALGAFTGFVEAGRFGGTVPGRNRAHYIRANSDGSWPSEWSLPAMNFQPEGPLPFSTNPVGVEQIGSELPETVTLLANYPNPFRESTTFDYTVTEKTRVSISVYNVIGQRVATVVDGVQPAGTYRATFEPRGLSSGTYFYRLEANGRVISRPMILVK